MEIFKIQIQEILSKTIDVQAQNIKEAISSVNEMYKSEKIILDYTDLSAHNILPVELIEEKDNLIKDIVDYLYLDEKTHFEELDKPNDHIFLKLERLKSLIQ